MMQISSPENVTAQAATRLTAFFFDNWYRILLSVAIVIIAVVLIRLFRAAAARMGAEYRLSPRAIRAFNLVITYGILLLAAINILAAFDIQLYSLIVSLGLISALMVMGSQLIISNLLGGVLVYVEKPFVEGDIIKVGDNTGVVEGISYRSTIMRGLNGLYVTIPNSTYLTSPIINYTRSHLYMVSLPFSAPRSANFSGLVDAIRARSPAIPGFVPGKGEALYKTGIAAEAVQYELHIWVSDLRNADEARSCVFELIAGLLKT